MLLCHPGIILDLGRLLGLAGSGTRLRSSSFGFGGFFCFLGFSFGFLLGLSSFLLFLKMSATPWTGGNLAHLFLLSLILNELLLLLQDLQSLLVGSSFRRIELGFVDLPVSEHMTICAEELTRFSGRLLSVVIKESMTLSPFCSKLNARLRTKRTPDTPLM